MMTIIKAIVIRVARKAFRREESISFIYVMIHMPLLGLSTWKVDVLAYTTNES